MDASLIPAFHDALVVAQTGSVGEAARRLHKTASAVSQQIRRIEARFGLALFEKVGRGIRPSAAGEALLGAEDAAGVAELVEAVGREQRGEQGDEDEQRGEDEPGDEHAALEAGAAPQRSERACEDPRHLSTSPSGR